MFLKKRYRKAVLHELQRTKDIKHEPLAEEDIRHLPPIVQKYLRVTGMIGRDKIVNFRAEFKGGLRSKPGDELMPLRSVQYNFSDNPSRLFYIVAKKMGIPAIGIHLYREAQAIFMIKIAGLIKVVDAKGKEMNQGETVTVFNDMCFIAPATLISKNISWQEIDPLTVHARFTNGSITIGATMHFNDKGELINFISNDRFETADGKVFTNYPWMTPVSGYREINGYRLAAGAKVIYKHPDEDFCYGEFEMVRVEYNCKEFK